MWRNTALLGAAIVTAETICPEGDSTCTAEKDEAVLLQNLISRHGVESEANHTGGSSSFWCPCEKNQKCGDAEKVALGQASGCDQNRALRDLKKLYQHIGDRTAPGGILLHGFGPDDINDILKRPLEDGSGLPTYRDMADCSVNNRHTCSAWSWSRKDLTSYAYNFPGSAVRTFALVDFSKAFSLTTFTGPTDRDTNDRNACSNNSPPNYSPPWQSRGGNNLPECMQQAASNAGIRAVDLVYQPAYDSGPPAARISCPEDDLRCKAVTSGGCVNHLWMLDQDWCKNSGNSEFENFQTCFSFQKVDGPPDGVSDFPEPGVTGNYWAVFFSGACHPCTQPYVCALKNPGISNKPKYVGSSQQFEQSVGVDGKKWADVYFSGLLDTSTTEKQCNFEQDKSPELVNAFHSYYEEAIRLQNTGSRPYQLYADPTNQIYLQSELNMYVDGNTFSEQYREQDELFFHSMVALSIDCRTCVEMLSFLDSKSIDYTIPGGPQTARERCVAYYKDENYEEQERKEINAARRLTTRLQARLTARLGRPVAVVETHFANNAAANLETFQEALDGNVPFENVYKRYIGFR